MKLKTIVSILSITLIMGYILGFIGNPFLFVIYFSVVAFGGMFLVIFYFAPNLVWKWLPSNTKKVNQYNKKRIKVIILVCFIFLFLGGWVINSCCLSELPHLSILIGNAGILFFTIFLGWSLVKLKKDRTIAASTAVFILFIAFLTFVSPKTNRDIKPLKTELLRSLPYIKWSSAEGNIQKSGVTYYNQKYAFKGINIYNSINLSAAYLMDMSGNILHTWSADMKSDDDTWHHIEMCKNGDLLVIIYDRMLIRLDWNSNIKWVKKIHPHHDIAIAGNNDIFVLDNRDELVFNYGLPIPILDDYIVVLSPDGQIKKEISLFKILKNEIPFDKFFKIYIWTLMPQKLKEMIFRKINGRLIFASDSSPDIFHTNTIEIIDRNIDGLCKKGDLLISIRQLNLIAILDVEKEKVVWKWGPGDLSQQHHPTLLKNGNILVFDNGVNRKYSRVVEINPLSKKIVWEYKSNPKEHFYSESQGASQRLPDGDTLITDSDSGRVFEVTNEGKIVWEFYNPEIKMDTEERAGIYRMMRITDPENYPCLHLLE